MKVCGSCKSPKPLTDFSAQAKSKDGLQYNCKACCAIDKRFRRYGVTKDWYETKLEEQDGTCGACGLSYDEYEHTRFRYFDVDHDHETGRPRGLLCNRCNMVLGQVRDDPQTLARLSRYLRKYKI